LMVKVKYIGYLAELVGIREEEIKVEKPVRVREILRIKSDLEELIILVNGLPGSLNSLVDRDDVVSVLPVISGG